MRDIKQEVIDKAIRFRDASLALARNQSKFFKGKDMNNLGDPKNSLNSWIKMLILKKVKKILKN